VDEVTDGFGRMACGRPVEKETAVQRRFLHVDSSSGSVLPDGERFEGREGLSGKTLMRGRRFFFLQKGSLDWLSSFDRHRSALLSGLHGKADCTGYIAIKLSCIHALHSRGLLVISVRFFFLIST
jgi:hypothetical protein